MSPFVKYILTAIILLAFGPTVALCQATPPALYPEWFNDVGGSTGTATATAVKIDGLSNVYVTGSFTGTVDFDPSAATSNLFSPLGATHGFIAKYKPDGTFVWAYEFAGPDVRPTSLSISPDGSITVVGNFKNTIDTDPGIGTHAFTASSGNDAFIVHLNANAGYVWAKGIGGSGEDIGNKVTADANGVYMALQFQSSINIDGNSYTAKGTTDGMLLKLDPVTGATGFALDLGYAGMENTASDIAVDKDGNIDLIGFLNGPVNFNPRGPGFALSAPQNAVYIAQYFPDGTLSWAKDIEQAFTNTAPLNNNNINLTLDGSNNVYVACAFKGTAKFLSGPTLTSKGNTDLLVARYGQSGTLSLYKNIGRSGAAIVPTGICVTGDNKYFYLTGYFAGTVDFSTNTAPSLVSNHGQQDLFLAKYNTVDFNYVVSVNVGNNACANNQSNAVAMTTSNKVLVTGAFCGNGAFGAECSAFNESAIGNHDMFLTTYSDPLPIANNIIQNPANCGGSGTLQGSVPTGGLGTYTYEWQRGTDGTHFTQVTPNGDGKDYAAPVESGKVYYVRKVTSSVCGKESYSNILVVDPSAPVGVQNNYIDTTGSLSGCGGAGSTNLKGSLPTGAGGGPYTYQWQISFDNFDWQPIVATRVTTPDSQNLGAISYNTSFYVRRQVTIPGCSTPYLSPAVLYRATPRLDHLEIHATGQTEFCDSGNPGTLTADRPPVGGNGVYKYQWRSTTPSVNLFTDIPGATNADYTPGVLTETTFFKREASSGPCYTGDPGINSNPIIITIKKLVPVTNNTIKQVTPDGVLCLATADPSPITGEVPGGGDGDFFYQWQQSADGKVFIDIGGATGKDYDPPKIKSDTYYQRVVTFKGISVCMTPNISNVIKVSVQTANVSNNTISQLDPDLPLICQVPADPKKITGSAAVGSGFTYQWQSSTDGVNFTDIAGATAKDHDPAEITQSTSYRRGAVVPGGCAAPLYSNIVTINVSPTATGNAITAPATTVFCDIGDADVIKGSTVNSNGVHYQWQSSPDSISFSDINGANYPDFDPLQTTSTVYYRRVVTTAVCNVPSITKVVPIKIFQTPVVKLSADSVYICFGENVTLTASGGTQYKWTPTEGLSDSNLASLKASPKTTTTYYVTVSNGGSCSVTGLIKVIVVPRVTVNAGADKRIFRGESVNLDGKITGDGVHYSWSPAAGIDDPNSLTPLVSPQKTTTYTLTATTDHGCSIKMDEVTISVYERVIIPTGFTPNNDGKNDLWEIPALTSYPGNILTVYNRNGTQVFKTISYASVWDGTYQGQTLPFGTYYYVIDLKDGTKPLSGWVSLIR